jgi:hypothetical protein
LLSVAALASPTNVKNLRRTEAQETASINLGSAKEFVILAKSGISTVAKSAITGDIGVSPIAATAITGLSLVNNTGQYSTSAQVVGKAYAADYADPTPEALTTAVSDMETAYANAAERRNEDNGRINIGKDYI